MTPFEAGQGRITTRDASGLPPPMARTAERNEQWIALQAIASLVSQSLDWNHVLSSALDQVLRLAEVEAGAIFLLEKSPRRFTLKAHQGVSPWLVNQIKQFRPDEVFLDSVARTGKPLIDEILPRDSDPLSTYLRHEGFWFYIAIPLKVKGEALGVMLLIDENTRKVNAESTQFLMSLGSILGLAIQNPLFYQTAIGLQEEASRQFDGLRESARQLQAVIENANDVVLIVQVGRLRHVNKYGLDRLGYTPEESRNLNFLDIIHPDDREVVANAYLRRLQGKDLPPSEIGLLRKDGTELPVSVITCPIEYNRRPAVLVIAKDMSELKHLREQTRQSEKMAALGQLISSVAHELSNPLTAVVGYSELLLLNERLPESLRLDLEPIHDAAQRASKIVQDLLTFARQRRGRKSLTDINDLLERTLALRSHEWRANNIEAVKELTTDLPPACADPHQLQQVFLNLMINAEQAMLEAHGKGRLVIRTRVLSRNNSQSRTTEPGDKPAANDQRLTTDDWIEIAICDDGPGIPPANLDRIFEPFFTTKVAGKGTGLGLSISQSIIQDHGGRIYASSQPGSGATFIIELPVGRKPAQLATAPHEQLPPPQAIPQNVLIIEDDLSIVKLLQKIVAAEGHRADIAMNGIEALAKLRQRSYDLIFCDTKMPQFSSQEMYHEVKQLSHALARKMVFVTSDLTSDEARAFLEQTGSRFIEKPFYSEDVVRMLRSVLLAEGPNGRSHHTCG